MDDIESKPERIGQFRSLSKFLSRKIYDKRISSSYQQLLICCAYVESACMHDTECVTYHERVVVICTVREDEKNKHKERERESSVSVLLFEDSLFLFFYYITTALWKHAAACSAGKSGYAEVISMIATAIEVELLVQ
ncbi:hypothetical protein T01_8439 [Trichinella spiralis]|uniref:Uncharacterized protein n=1 Tax=Trichinella spiralis TaxID=6334 RepID=A0A0V1BK25_TRISP|nr:hypothetical protein T01_8439 [Trichinella spiralis]